MLIQHLLLIFLINNVKCRIFKRSTIDEVFESENAEHYLKSDGESSEDHEVVKIFTDKSTNDSELELHFKAFNETINVTLQLHEEEYFITENTPVWLKMRGNRYRKADDFAIKHSLRAYSSADGSCFVITDVLKMSKNKGININGVIGDYAIRSLPSGVHDSLNRAKRHIDENDYYSEYMSDNFIPTDFHIVHKRKPSDKNLTYTDIIGDDAKANGRIKRELSDIPEFVYPRILLVTHCNNAFRNTRDPEIDNFILYLLSFWATVDMKFRSFELPKIRLHISGIIIETKYKYSKIIMRSLIEEDPDDDIDLEDRSVDVIKMHQRMNLYYGNTVDNSELLPIFAEAPSNVIVAMVGLDLYQSMTDADFYTAVNGLTVSSKECRRLSDASPWSTALYSIIQHWGFQYEGLLTAAHEMGHVLGACHDDNKACGAVKERNMMFVNGAGLNISEDSNEWSECSIRTIRETAVKRKDLPCMDFTEKPRGQRICIPLPGQRVSLDKQCRSKELIRSCDPEEKLDENYRRNKKRGSYSADCHLYCRVKNVKKYGKYSSKYDCVDYGLVLDGFLCKDNYHCINGKCIPIPSGSSEKQEDAKVD